MQSLCKYLMSFCCCLLTSPKTSVVVHWKEDFFCEQIRMKQIANHWVFTSERQQIERELETRFFLPPLPPNITQAGLSRSEKLYKRSQQASLPNACRNEEKNWNWNYMHIVWGESLQLLRAKKHRDKLLPFSFISSMFQTLSIKFRFNFEEEK